MKYKTFRSYLYQHDLGEKGGFRRFVDLRKQNPDLKIMVAIGGWGEGGKKYSEMASLPERRAAATRSIVRQFIFFLLNTSAKPIASLFFFQHISL